jgi:putative transposase
MTFTAQKIKEDLQEHNPTLLEGFKVEAKDRLYQIWERNPLTVDLFSPKVFHQKIDYVHFNAVRAGQCINAENYYYSSAKFYTTGVDVFNMLTHYDGWVFFFKIMGSPSVVGTLGCLTHAAYQQRLRFTKLNQYFEAL